MITLTCNQMASLEAGKISNQCGESIGTAVGATLGGLIFGGGIGAAVGVVVGGLDVYKNCF